MADTSFSDSWFNPQLLDCSCRRCSRGGQCAEMQELFQRRAELDERQARLSSLTDGDKAWLAEHGWNGS